MLKHSYLGPDRDPFDVNCPHCQASLRRTFSGLFQDCSNGHRHRGEVCCPECDKEVSARVDWSVTWLELEDEGDRP